MTFDEQQKLKQLLNGKSIQDKVSLNSSGFGFGLTISNILAKKISKKDKNNSIKFTSKQNQGSTFWFYLDAVQMIKKINSKTFLSFQQKNNSVQQILQQSNIYSLKPAEEQAELDQGMQKELAYQNSFNQQTKAILKESTIINNAESIHTNEESQIQPLINSQIQSLNNQATNSASNQMLMCSSQVIKNISKDFINPIPQIRTQQSKFKQQQNAFQYEPNICHNNPKILQKYIILSNQEIIELEESDIFEQEKMFQEGITQSQSIDLKLLSDHNKQLKPKQQSICENQLNSNEQNNSKQEVEKKQSCKNILKRQGSRYNNSSITQSYIFTISSNELKKKQKEEQKIACKRQSLNQNKSTSLKSLKINKSFENASEQISFIDIAPIESVQVQLPKQVNNKFFSANKIMIVDDEPMNIKGLQIMLKVKADIQEDLIFTASNGIEAVDLFKQSLKSINQIKLIFMDINMPLLDGIEATKQIRQLESKCKNQKRVSICAYTCWTDLQTKIKCSQAGMDSYFSKPITHDQLIVALNRYYFNQ